MKKLFTLLLLASVCFSFGCEQFADDPGEDVLSDELELSSCPDPEKYNAAFNNIAFAVSKAVQSSDEFRKIIKDEAMLMIDGDYDVIVSRIIDKEVSPPDSKNQNFKGSYTVGDLLEDAYREFSIFKSESSLIEDLSEEYPYLQIAVPVHAEEWDESTYVPTVTYIPADCDENTEVILGYDSDGNIVEIDAINEPDDPVIVISENERIDLVKDDPVLTAPAVPANLTGAQTESGIRICWEMPAECNPANTTGYYVFRKGAEDTSYEQLMGVFGAYNRCFDDIYVEPSRSYSYYVKSYYQGEISGPSNYISVKAPEYPNPVLSLDAIQNTENEIELRWQNDHSQYISETRLSRYIVGETEGYELIGSFTPDEHGYFDRNISKGKKIIYKINHVTPVGASNPKYDFVKVPFRDPTQKSPVYIKQIRFSDWSLEPWYYGKPEFKITVTNVDPKVKEPYVIQDEIRCDFLFRSNFSQVFIGVKVLDWQPGFWYDMISFYAVEYDRPWGELDITASVGYNQKNEEKTGFYADRGVDYKYTIEEGGERCGSASLDYFDNPDTCLTFPNYGVRIYVSTNYY